MITFRARICFRTAVAMTIRKESTRAGFNFFGCVLPLLIVVFRFLSFFTLFFNVFDHPSFHFIKAEWQKVFDDNGEKKHSRTDNRTHMYTILKQKNGGKIVTLSVRMYFSTFVRISIIIIFYTLHRAFSPYCSIWICLLLFFRLNISLYLAVSTVHLFTILLCYRFCVELFVPNFF